MMPDKAHLAVVAIGAGFTVATVALLLHFKVDLALGLLPIGGFVATIAGLFTRQLGKGSDQ